MNIKTIQRSTIIIVLFVFGCKQQAPVQEKVAKVPVNVRSVVKKELIFPIHTSGRLSSSSEQKLSFKTGGIIDRILADEGRNVKKGQLLAKLKLSEISAQVNKAQQAADKAERDYTRASNLYKDSVVTLEQLQDVKTALDVAKANLEIASFNLNYSKITAPTDGRILKRLAEENEVIGQGYPVFLFGSTSGNWVMHTGITDKDVVRVQPDDSAHIRFDAFPGKVFTATVSEIGKMADPYTGTYEIELSVKPVAGKHFLSGLIGEADIYSGKKKMYYAIPADALINSSEMSGDVYVLEKNKPVKRKVYIAEIENNEILVNRGLNENDTVITEGMNYIKEGSEVEIIH